MNDSFAAWPRSRDGVPVDTFAGGTVMSYMEKINFITATSNESHDTLRECVMRFADVWYVFKKGL